MREHVHPREAVIQETEEEREKKTGALSTPGR